MVHVIIDSFEFLTTFLGLRWDSEPRTLASTWIGRDIVIRCATGAQGVESIHELAWKSSGHLGESHMSGMPVTKGKGVSSAQSPKEITTMKLSFLRAVIGPSRC